MRANLFVVAAALSMAAHAVTAEPTTEIVQYYSEAVRCNAKLFTPANHGSSSTASAVVLAPDQGETRASIDPVAEVLAKQGIVALAIDYRGWGECGGFLYFAEPVRWDDRLRFMQMTTDMRVRRLRIDPKSQVIDIRNAITFLQSVPGVDRARIGVWGTGLSGGHAVVVAGSDARVKAIVAQSPMLAGKDEPRAAFAPTPQQQAMMIKLARTGAAPANNRAAKAMNADEAALALAEYKPYWYLEQIPETTSVLFVTEASQANAADAAAKLLKGSSSVRKLEKGREAEAAGAAAEWFVSHLK